MYVAYKQLATTSLAQWWANFKYYQIRIFDDDTYWFDYLKVSIRPLAFLDNMRCANKGLTVPYIAWQVLLDYQYEWIFFNLGSFPLSPSHIASTLTWCKKTLHAKYKVVFERLMLKNMYYFSSFGWLSSLSWYHMSMASSKAFADHLWL